MSVIQTSNQDVSPPTADNIVSAGSAGMAPVPIALAGFEGGHISIVNGSTTEPIHVLFSSVGAPVAAATDWFIPPLSSERYRLDSGSAMNFVSLFAAAAALYVIRRS